MRGLAAGELITRSAWVRGLLLALFVSNTGTFVQSTAQAWLVWELTHSTAMLGLLGLVQATPLLGISLLGGALADQRPRRSLLLATQSILALTAAAMSALTFFGHLSVTILLAMAAILATVAAFDNPVRQVYLPGVVLTSERGRVVGLNALAYNLGAVIGPALAGLMLATTGAAWCFLANAVSYLATVAWLLPGPPGRAAPHPHKSSGAAGRFLRSSVSARRMLLLVAIVSLLGRSYVHVLSAVVADLWGGGAGVYGTLAAVPGAGAVIAAALVAWVLGRRAHHWLPWLGALTLGGLTIGLGLVSSPVAAAAMLVLIGLTATGTMTLLNVSLQIVTPDAVRGRVLSLYTWLAAGLPALGGWLLGTVMGRLTPPQTLALAGGALIGLTFLAEAPQMLRRTASAAQADRASDPGAV